MCGRDDAIGDGGVGRDWSQKAPRILGQTVGTLCAERSGLAVKQNRAPEPVSPMRARYQRAVGVDRSNAS